MQEHKLLENYNFKNLLPSPTEVRRVVTNKEFKLMKVSDLQHEFPLIDWRGLFQILTGRAIQDNGFVQVYFPEYISKIFHKLSNMHFR